MSVYHYWKEDGSLFDVLNHPQQDHADKLETSEEVDSLQRDSSKVRVVWLMFGRHQEQHQTVKELQPVEGCNSHVEEDAVKHRQRDQSQGGCHEYRQSHQQKDQDVSYPLLPENIFALCQHKSIFDVRSGISPNAQKLWFLSRCCCFRLPR